MTAAMVTYLGENTVVEEFDVTGKVTGHREVPGPAFTEWRGVRFHVNRPFRLDPATVNRDERVIYEAMINKLKNNPHFKVEDAPAIEVAAEDPMAIPQMLRRTK